MFFNQAKVPKPIGIPINWVAEYVNGDILSEYDFETHKPNNFYSIRQNEVVRFGLFGNGIKMYFDKIDGHFHLNGRRIDIVYKENGRIHNLTNNIENKDLITFKQAYTNFDRNSIIQSTNIESINFGYKTFYKKDDLILFFQPIVSLPFGNSAFIETKLTSNKSLEGELIFYVSNKERERFYAPLKKEISGVINWTIK